VRRIEAACVGYLTPLFERNALAAAGVERVPATWRRGDLVILDRIESLNDRPTPFREEGRWKEVRRGDMSIRVRVSGSRGVPILRSIVVGDVLDAVSRRDERRRAVDLWTTGNRVLACSSPLALHALLENLVAGGSVVPDTILGRPPRPGELDQLAATGRQLSRLVALEQRDVATYRADLTAAA